MSAVVLYHRKFKFQLVMKCKIYLWSYKQQWQFWGSFLLLIADAIGVIRASKSRAIWSSMCVPTLGRNHTDVISVDEPLCQQVCWSPTTTHIQVILFWFQKNLQLFSSEKFRFEFCSFFFIIIYDLWNTRNVKMFIIKVYTSLTLNMLFRNL